MTTTTYAALVARAVEVLEALAPSSPPERPRFRRALPRHDFREWALENPGACMRQFELRRTGAKDNPGTWAPDARRVLLDVALVVAYPAQLPGLFGPDDRDSMEAVIDADARKIDDALCSGTTLIDGHSATYVRVEAPDRSNSAVWFQDFTLTLDFFEAMART